MINSNLPFSPGNREKYRYIEKSLSNLFAVSTIDIGSFKIAFYHEDYGRQGNWGYIDGNGVEVIAPQYLFTNHFVGNTILVCKGKWEYREDWYDSHNHPTVDGWWSKEMLWGILDEHGNEVIPCIYDDIKMFNNSSGEC